eukprot:gene8851-18339_t
MIPLGAAIITGGARRIGREICLRLARKGHPIIIHYNNSVAEASKLKADIEKLCVPCIIYHTNLEDSNSLEGMVESAAQLIKSDIDVLVNCASVFEPDTIESIDLKGFTKHMTVNVLSPLLLASQFLEHVKNRKTSSPAHSSIINILDQKIAAPNGDHMSYTASRFALHGMTDSLARTCTPTIRVNAVAPGFTLPHSKMSDLDFVTAQQQGPLGYGPSPEDIAEAVAFLVSARSVTGQTIFVDAGERFNARRNDV